MKRWNKKIAALVSLLVCCLTGVSHSQQTGRSTLFSVGRQHFEGGDLSAVLVAIVGLEKDIYSKPLQRNEAVSAYYQKGKIYRAFDETGEKGPITIGRGEIEKRNGPWREGCDMDSWAVGYGTFPTDGATFATDSKNLSRSAKPRSLTYPEQDLLMKQARIEFEKRKVPPRALLLLRISQGWGAIDLDGDQKEELIANIDIPIPPHIAKEEKKFINNLFLVLTPQGQNGEMIFHRFGYRPPYDGGWDQKDASGETFEAAIDLEGDGILEMITSFSTNHESGYRIYKQSPKHQWQLRYEYLASGC